MLSEAGEVLTLCMEHEAEKNVLKKYRDKYRRGLWLAAHKMSFSMWGRCWPCPQLINDIKEQSPLLPCL